MTLLLSEYDRLVARAEPGQIVATADVLERARTRYDTGRQPLLVKGKDRPVTAYTVGEPVDRSRPLQQQPAQIAVPPLADAHECRLAACGLL